MRNVYWLISAIIVLLLGGCSPSYVLNVSSGGVPDESNAGIVYGDHERHAYDLYWPDAFNEDTPVIIFFYGGSWDSGQRGDYAFVGNGLADDGYIVAVVDYRVYPDVAFPAFVEDGAAAVAKIHMDMGADRRVFLMGHSAGAQIAALLAFDPRYLIQHELIACEVVHGFIGLAGPYDFLPLKKERLRQIFAEPIRDQSQPINYVGAQSPRSLLIHGETDSTVLPRNTHRLNSALAANGVPVTTRIIENAGHVKVIAAIAGALKKTAPVRPEISSFISESLADSPTTTCR